MIFIPPISRRVVKILVLVVGVLLIFPLPSFAQSSDEPFLITSWKAASYVPPGYRGKAFPVPGTDVEISLSLVDNGQLIDLSSREVQWVINGNLRSGVGLQSIRFEAEGRVSQRIRVTVPQYNSQNIVAFFDIPTTNPQLVLRFLGRNDDRKAYLFETLPYFFNITALNQLRLTWEVSGQSVEDTADTIGILELDAEDLLIGSQVSMNVAAVNILDPREEVRRSVKVAIR